MTTCPSEESPIPSKRDVLEEAITTVAGRGKSYGRPEDNFERIARLWSVHLINRYGKHPDPDVKIQPYPYGLPDLDAQDVAMMMVLMKVARLENDPSHHDSIVDVIGYAACLGEIVSKEPKNGVR